MSDNVVSLENARATPAAQTSKGPRGQDIPNATPLSEKLSRLGMTDADNVQRFVARFGDKAVYVVGQEWHMWNGAQWQLQPEDANKVGILVEQMARGIMEEARFLPEKSRVERCRWSQSCLNGSRVNAVLTHARRHNHIMPDQLDADPWILNVQNGMVDLRTGDLKPHDPKAFCRKIVPIAYDPNAKCSKWLEALRVIFKGDAEMIAYLKRAIGYTLTGSTREQVMFITWGAGSNGKSIVQNVTARMLGEYGATAPESLATKRPGEQKGHPADQAMLEGARYVMISETEEGAVLDESLIKRMTGGDTISARFMGKNFFTFRPILKPWMSTNNRPRVHGRDHGIWRRVRLIPFEQTFAKPEDIRKPEFEGKPVADLDLENRLIREELEGILAWAVEGAVEWNREGLKDPQKVLLATEEYKADQDPLAQWMDQCLEFGNEKARLDKRDLMACYDRWCHENYVTKVHSTTLKRMIGNDKRFQTIVKIKGWPSYAGVGLSEVGHELVPRSATGPRNGFIKEPPGKD